MVFVFTEDSFPGLVSFFLEDVFLDFNETLHEVADGKHGGMAATFDGFGWNHGFQQGTEARNLILHEGAGNDGERCLPTVNNIAVESVGIGINRIEAGEHLKDGEV